MVYSDFPYQIIALLGTKAVSAGDRVYDLNNWPVHLTLKRRFQTLLDDEKLVETLEGIMRSMPSLSVTIDTITEDDRLPVAYLSIKNAQEIMKHHMILHDALAPISTDKFPEREGATFFPHVTYTYSHKVLFDATDYESRAIPISSLWLIKDGETASDTRFLHKFKLG